MNVVGDECLDSIKSFPAYCRLAEDNFLQEMVKDTAPPISASGVIDLYHWHLLHRPPDLVDFDVSEMWYGGRQVVGAEEVYLASGPVRALRVLKGPAPYKVNSQYGRFASRSVALLRRSLCYICMRLLCRRVFAL